MGIHLSSKFIKIKNAIESFSEPTRSPYVQNRIFKIRDLLSKHNAKTTIDLIKVKENLSSKFSNSKDLENEVQFLKNQTQELENKCQILAEKIFIKRKQRVVDLQKELQIIFNNLSMKESRIKFDLEKSDQLNK